MTQFETQLRELTNTPESWGVLKDDWQRQCEPHGETIDDYAIGAMSTIEDLVLTPAARAKPLGLYDTMGNCHAVCFANIANIPGYREPVLRIRHIVLSPNYDFGALDSSAYEAAITTMFAGVVSRAFGDMRAKHIKFHLRSPADVSFFSAVAKTLASVPVFQTVQMKGAWLYLDLAEIGDLGTGAEA